MDEFTREQRAVRELLGRPPDVKIEDNAWLLGGRMNEAIIRYLPTAPLGPEILAPGAPKPRSRPAVCSARGDSVSCSRLWTSASSRSAAVWPA